MKSQDIINSCQTITVDRVLSQFWCDIYWGLRFEIWSKHIARITCILYNYRGVYRYILYIHISLHTIIYISIHNHCTWFYVTINPSIYNHCTWFYVTINPYIYNHYTWFYVTINPYIYNHCTWFYVTINPYIYLLYMILCNYESFYICNHCTWFYVTMNP